ncbi:MAG: hypothetical protein ABIV28_03325, partial [Longimicrobiales bacterium]
FAFAKSLRLDVRYRTTDLDGFDLRGGQRLQNERKWPSVTVTMRDVRIPKPLQKYVVNFSIDGGIDRVLTTNQYGVGELQRREAERYEIPVNSSISLQKAISFVYAGKYTIGTYKEPTGRRETLTGYHRFGLNSILPAPLFLSSKLDDPVQATLSFLQTTTTQCGSASILNIGTCTAQIEATTRNGQFQLDTGLQEMRIGMRLDYNARQNHVGTQTGTSEVRFSLFGQFNLTAGKDISTLGGIR